MVPAVPTLEQLLRAWEDSWLLLNAHAAADAGQGHARRIPAERAMVNWRRFRRFLVQAHQLAAQTDDGILSTGDFDRPENMPDESRGFLVDMAAIFGTWQLTSRRSYRLSREVGAILRHTSIGDVTWNDLEPPFPCFVIELDEPWVDPDSGPQKRAYQTLVATRFFTTTQAGPRPYWELRFVDARLGNYQPVTRLQRERLDTMVRRQQWRDVKSECAARLRPLDNVAGVILGLDGADLDEPVVQTAARIAEIRRTSGRPELYPGSERCLEQMVRIFVGLVLYLRSLPAGSPHLRSARGPRISTPDRAVITDGSEIFTVQSVWDLSPDERVALGLQGTAAERAAFAMAWHFREAHWRRPPGHGRNPAAERSVHVRWTMVRRDRMPQDEGLPRSGEERV